MKRVDYYLLDVFTHQPFSGNQLAVFMPCDALDSATMQTLARELNLAETVFLGQPRSSNHYPMRIFTPAEELDFAGHPTIGTALLLAELGLVERTRILTLTPPVGELVTEFVDKQATFTTARPAEISQSPLSGPAAAALLGLQAHQVIGTPVLSSCGLAYHLIELADTTALGEVRLSATHWDDDVSPSGVEQVYLYVGPTPGEEAPMLRTRMFCREHGLCEDAATGSAAAALSGYLATMGNARRWTLHQGVEMGRPSVISTSMKGDRVQVGGQAIVVGKGEFYLG